MSNVRTESSALRGPMLIVISALFCSTSGTCQVLAPPEATPYVVGALRMGVAGLALLAWCAYKGILPRAGTWPLKNLVGGLAGLLFCQIFFFQGMKLAGVAMGAVVTLGSSPLFAALLSWIFLGERPIKAWYPATVLGLAGLMLSNLAGADAGAGFWRLMPSLAAGLGYAAYLVASKPLTQINPPETVMMLIALGTGICLIPAYFIYPVAWVVTPHGLVVSAYLGLMTMAIPFTMFLTGLKTTPTSTASTLGLVEPLGASILGFVFLKEPINIYTFSGLVCIFAAAFILIVASGRAPTFR